MKLRLHTAAVAAGLCVCLVSGMVFIAGGQWSAKAREEIQSLPAVGADVFRDGSIPELRVELDPGALESLRRKPREYVMAKVTEGATVYEQVGVHLKGKIGSFRPVDEKPSLTLDFCRFEKERRFHGLRKIHLNNSVEDPSYANEKLGSELFRSAGVPAPRVTRALVTLNSRARGLYVLKEGFTEDFLSLHYGSIGIELYEPSDGHDVNGHLDRNSVRPPGRGGANFMGGPVDEGPTALKRLARAALLADPVQRWAELEAALDAREFLAFMSMEIMLGHRDGYCLARNNYRVYHDVEKDRMVFFPQGMDQLFGTADLPWQPYQEVALSARRLVVAGLVAQALIGTPEGRAQYAVTFGSLLTNVFRVQALTNRVDELERELRPVLSRGEWVKVRQACGDLKERIAQREASLVAQMQRPPMGLLVFRDGVGHPEGWEISTRPGQGEMGKAELEGKAVLHIGTTAETTASWHARVLLPAGRYRFQGEVRVAGVKPLAQGVYQGAGLRIGGGYREQVSFIGDSAWQTVGTGFQVKEPVREVELICELRAQAGTAWFDVASLCVLRMDDL